MAEHPCRLPRMGKWGIRGWGALVLTSACGGSPAPVQHGAALVVPASAPSVEKPHGNEMPAPEACESLPTQDVRFSADGGSFVVSYGARIDAYSTADWSRRSRIEGTQGGFNLQLSSDGRFVIQTALAESHSDQRSEIIVSDTTTGKSIWRSEFVRPLAGTDPVAIAPDASWFAFAVADPDAPDEQHVELVSLPSLESIGKLAVPSRFAQLKRPTWRPRMLPPPRRVGTLTLNVPNDPPDWSSDRIVLVPTVQRLLAAPDSRYLAIGWEGTGGATSLIDAKRAKEVVSMPGGGGTFSPQGRFLVLYQGSGAIGLWDIEQRKGTLFYDPLCQPQGMMTEPSFSPDESRVAFAGFAFRACLVETASAKPRGLIPPQLPAVAPFEDEGFTIPGAWTSDGAAILMAMSLAGDMELFDTASTKLTPLGPGLRADAPMADNGSGYISVIRRSSDQSLVVFNPAGHPAAEILGTQVRPLAFGRGESFMPVAVTPDGERYARSDEQGAVVRSTRTGEVLATLPGAADATLAFEPSGRFVYTTDRDGLRVWDSMSGEQRLALRTCPK